MPYDRIEEPPIIFTRDSSNKIRLDSGSMSEHSEPNVTMHEILIKAAMALIANRPKPILDLVKKHFGKDTRNFPIVAAEFSKYRHPCVTVAIQAYLSQRRCRAKILGNSSPHKEPRFEDLIHPDNYVDQTEGPIQYIDVALFDGTRIACPRQALYLVRDNGHKYAVYVTRGSSRWDNLYVEVMAPERERAEQWLANIRKMADEHSIYKGQVLTMKESDGIEPDVVFQRTREIDRDKLILPSRIIDELERHTSRFSQFRQQLLSRGQHLKRGLLLYGPPGTGKSLSIMYLISAMKDRTTILLNGSAVQFLEEACTLARTLEPSLVVIDDADLIATERARRQSNPMLFELLNQMDGISDDADILFLLTTNRPEVIEPAISDRPGRIDQAIMIPLPDEECRTRLFALYSREMPLAVKDLHRFISMTEGVSAAFIRELLRKASVLALEEGLNQPIEDAHIEIALQAMLGGDSMTARLLGHTSPHSCSGVECRECADANETSAETFSIQQPTRTEIRTMLHRRRPR